MALLLLCLHESFGVRIFYLQLRSTCPKANADLSGHLQIFLRKPQHCQPREHPESAKRSHGDLVQAFRLPITSTDSWEASYSEFHSINT